MNGFAQRGAAPVGQLAYLPVVEAASVIYLRHWCAEVGKESLIETEFENSLGEHRGRHVSTQFRSLCEMCFSHARRPFVRHTIGCKCVGADEACFANLVASASEADTEDAMMIATLIVRAEVAPLITSLAVEVGMGLKQMQLARPQGFTPSSNRRNARVLH